MIELLEEVWYNVIDILHTLGVGFAVLSVYALIVVGLASAVVFAGSGVVYVVLWMARQLGVIV